MAFPNNVWMNHWRQRVYNAGLKPANLRTLERFITWCWGCIKKASPSKTATLAT